MWSNWKAWWRQADRRRSPDIPNPQPVPLPPEAGPVEIQRPPLADGGTPEVFEPALRHCNRAFRAGDPVFSDDSTQRVWQLARRSAIDHVLQIVERSQWNQHLVLRGSILLQAWFGDEAREPGDIDWIYRPQSEAMDSPRATQMFQELRAEVGQNPSAGLATFLPDQLVESEIWTYERAPGKRLVFPWRTADGLRGSVQIDVVFGEELWTDPVQTPIPRADGQSTVLWTVDRELSLASKILWLETDTYPQGKDLFDAALLANTTAVRKDLLLRILRHSGQYGQAFLDSAFPLSWHIDWDNFIAEAPWVSGTAAERQKKISLALQRAWENENGIPGGQ